MRKKFSYQIVSKLHLESAKQEPKLSVVASNIFLLGDIGKIKSDSYRDFIRTCSNHFEHVYIIGGEGEYRGQYEREYLNQYMRTLCDKYDNVTWIDDKTLFFDGLLIGTDENVDIRLSYDRIVGKNGQTVLYGNSIHVVDEIIDDVRYISNPYGRRNSHTGYCDICIEMEYDADDESDDRSADSA